MPLAWDKREHIGDRSGVDYPEKAGVPVEAELIVKGARPIPTNLWMGDSRGEFRVTLEVSYPPSVDRAKILFRHGERGKPIAEWVLTNLPRTKNGLAAMRLTGRSAKSADVSIVAAACLHRSPNLRDDPDEIVVAAQLAGKDANSALMKDIQLNLPFVDQAGASCGESVTLGGARRFMTALTSPYADGIDAVRLEATLVPTSTTPMTLHVGSVLLQKSRRGITVAGQRWTTTVNGFRVFVSDPPGETPNRSGTVSLNVGVRPESPDKDSWFEIQLSDGSYSGKADSTGIEIPVKDGKRVIDLELQGRIVTTKPGKRIVLRVPVLGSSLPKGFPPYKEASSLEPYIEGSTGG